MTCPDPQSPINGYIEVSEYTGEYVFGSVAHYHCNPGYRLADTGHTELMVCGERGEWGAETRRDPGTGVRVTHQGSDVTSPRGPHICEPVTCEVLTSSFYYYVLPSTFRIMKHVPQPLAPAQCSKSS